MVVRNYWIICAMKSKIYYQGKYRLYVFVFCHEGVELSARTVFDNGQYQYDSTYNFKHVPNDDILENNVWNPWTDMIQARTMAGSIVINDNQLWVAGGWTGNPATSKSFAFEICKDDK